MGCGRAGPAERCAGWRGRAWCGGLPEGDRVGRGTPGGASAGCPGALRRSWWRSGECLERFREGDSDGQVTED